MKRRIYKNLIEMQEDSCKLYNNNEIFGTKNQEGHYKWITYGQFKLLVDDMRGGLNKLGVTANDKVGIIAHNRTEWAVACYATLGLRGQFVSMYENQFIDDWQYIIEDSECKIVFVSSEKIYHHIKHLQKNLTTLKHIVLLSNDENHKPEKNSYNYYDLLRIGQDHPVPSIHPDSNDLMGIIYTSGTTGRPKGVMLSHGNILSNVHVCPDIVTFTPSDRTFSLLPWAHIFGQTAEVHLLIYSGFSTGFLDNPNTLTDDIVKVKPTILFAVPKVFNNIYEGINSKVNSLPSPVKLLFKTAMELSNRKRDTGTLPLKGEITLKFVQKTLFKAVRKKFGGRLKYAVSGASALNPKVGKFIDNLGITLLEAYGLSETSPLVAANTLTKRRFGSVGPIANNPFVNISVKIDHAVLGENVQSCEEGEIVVYGPNVMRGYFKQPEETKLVMTSDGGFRTGDLGRIDEDGFLHITGRIKEQYKLLNGKYVVPNVIEDQYKLSSYIANAFIYGSNKKYNIVLIVVNMKELLKWAKAQDINSSDKKLLEHHKTLALYKKELENFNEFIKQYEQPKSFALIDDEWSVENSLITPTLKLKRQNIYNRYKNLIEALCIDETNSN
ncbi:MAG: long-chain fatty acid--CoA ligase [Oligoflexia bacterium]|nr:long-chain fatty acid--CoA ligase [Oligoflexia bacterium]